MFYKAKAQQINTETIAFKSNREGHELRLSCYFCQIKANKKGVLAGGAGAVLKSIWWQRAARLWLFLICPLTRGFKKVAFNQCEHGFLLLCLYIYHHIKANLLDRRLVNASESAAETPSRPLCFALSSHKQQHGAFMIFTWRCPAAPFLADSWCCGGETAQDDGRRRFILKQREAAVTEAVSCLLSSSSKDIS